VGPYRDEDKDHQGRGSCGAGTGEVPFRVLSPSLARPVWLDAVITDVRDVALADLSDEDAAAENFEHSGALQDALRYHYPGLPGDAAVVVANFELI
jgi:hypothetical protein